MKYEGLLTTGIKDPLSGAIDVLYVGNDNLLTLEGLRNAAFGGLYLSNATVRAIVKTLAGSTLSGVTFPVTLSPVSGAQGLYEGVLDDNLALVNGTFYYIEVTVTASSDTVAFFRNKALARTRQG